MRLSATVVLAGLLALVSAQNVGDCSVVGNYTVVKGDTLSSIATAKNVTLAAVEYVNPQITNFNFISIGEVIYIPAKTCNPTASSGTPAPTATCAVAGTPSTYTVVAGDTFYIISTEKFNITLASLVAANPQVKDVTQIAIGQVLNIPVCRDCVVSPSTYTVVSGDTFNAIAKKFNITVAALSAANPQVVDINSINVGDVLKLPKCKGT